MAKEEVIEIGELPIDKINRALDTELDPGMLVLTPGSARHVKKSHPDEYDQCLPHLQKVISDPSYIGDDFRNKGKFELVRPVQGFDGQSILVAVVTEPDEKGNYRVASFYPVSQAKVDKRRQKGTLIIAR
ncbi:PBECR2 nuclease fold domain-containing protein [uncultured Cohaesibacter sp.]|uniref:PBECR3 domain-containing polyvalent protein n=1 Tax=uncultured Cohaesibacter sp. TaxID=1002546 RepID=UPI0029C86924|nr:PBECR2 nuclease fold domain-containing protein [uncultured Cohaesibacter sp.]